jgi:hypothetical protein
MEILIVLGLLAGICGLSSMTKKDVEVLEKCFSEIAVAMAFLIYIVNFLFVEFWQRTMYNNIDISSLV